jgi:hypothetical protein
MQIKKIAEYIRNNGPAIGIAKVPGGIAHPYHIAALAGILQPRHTVQLMVIFQSMMSLKKRKG